MRSGVTLPFTRSLGKLAIKRILETTGSTCNLWCGPTRKSFVTLHGRFLSNSHNDFAKENEGGVEMQAPFEQRYFVVPAQTGAELKLARSRAGQRSDAERSQVLVNSELGAASTQTINASSRQRTTKKKSAAKAKTLMQSRQDSPASISSALFDIHVLVLCNSLH